MKILIFGMLLCCGISACKSDSTEEVIDFDELSKPSDKYNGQDTLSDTAIAVPVYFDSVSVFSQQLIDSMAFDKKMIFKLDTLIFPDRFGALKTDKWYYLSPKDSLVFMYWQFGSKVKAENTFFNWLDCYGRNCKSIAIGDPAIFSKRGTLFLQDEKDLIFIESRQKINEERLLEILSHLRKTSKAQYFTWQQPGKKANWKTIDKEGVSSEDVRILKMPTP